MDLGLVTKKVGGRRCSLCLISKRRVSSGVRLLYAVVSLNLSYSSDYVLATLSALPSRALPYYICCLTIHKCLQILMTWSLPSLAEQELAITPRQVLGCVLLLFLNFFMHLCYHDFIALLCFQSHCNNSSFLRKVEHQKSCISKLDLPDLSPYVCMSINPLCIIESGCIGWAFKIV